MEERPDYPCGVPCVRGLKRIEPDPAMLLQCGRGCWAEQDAKTNGVSQHPTNWNPLFLLIHGLVWYCVTIVTDEHVVIKIFENCTEQCLERAHKNNK